MNATLLFQICAATVTATFVWFGMDVRRKRGSGDLVAAGWQLAMKFCSFSLISVSVWIVLALEGVAPIDWLALGFMSSGTVFVVAAKRALGSAHTFTGQCRREPQLITRSVYGCTRNPLYFGVLQCEMGAAVLVFRHGPFVWPELYSLVLGVLAAMLLYAVVFNWRMACLEAHSLENHFPAAYGRYKSEVPFILPRFRLGKEAR